MSARKEGAQDFKPKQEWTAMGEGGTQMLLQSFMLLDNVTPRTEKRRSREKGLVEPWVQFRNAVLEERASHPLKSIQQEVRNIEKRSGLRRW